MTSKLKTAKHKQPTERSARMATPPQPPTTKKAQLIALLRHKGGQEIAGLSHALGWQAHTVRAALTGLRKAGYEINRTVTAAGVGRYQITGGA